MRAAKQCSYHGRTIQVEEALEIREDPRTPRRNESEFLCLECGEQIWPHRSSDNGEAHFEHLRRNTGCSFSAGPVPADTGTRSELFDIEDQRAVEGYKEDRWITSQVRNARLVRACKERDNFTCQACKLRLQVGARYVIECHHKIRIAQDGEREVSLDELISLCPTCHRIAHTRAEPLTVEEIREARGDL